MGFSRSAPSPINPPVTHLICKVSPVILSVSEIRLVGTAHVSAQSVEDVKKAIEEWHPDIIAVELDLGRYHALKKDVKDPSVEDVLEVKNFNQLLIQ